jgi:hypothetical protein
MMTKFIVWCFQLHKRCKANEVIRADAVCMYDLQTGYPTNYQILQVSISAKLISYPYRPKILWNEDFMGFEYINDSAYLLMPVANYASSKA